MEGFRGYNPESGQAAAGEDGAAARPTENEYGPVVSKRRQNESDPTDERSAREGEKGQKKAAPTGARDRAVWSAQGE